MGLTLSTDRTLVRAGSRSTRYVTAHYTAPEATRRTGRRPLDVAIVIDRSGSMSGPKLQLARQAARRAVQLLGPQDFVALVAYDTEVDRMVPGARLTPDHRRTLLEAIDRLRAGSSTNLSGGWLTGCEEVGRSARPEAVARVLLLSDGLANHGITNRDTLAHHASELRTRGVVSSCIGIGHDFDERLMEGMARAGGGNFYYLENPEQIPDYLASELGDALEVVARGVTLDLESDIGMEISSLDNRMVQREGRRTRVLVGDLVDHQEVELVLKVTFPRREEGATVGLTARLVDGDGALDTAAASVRWEYAGHQENNVQPRRRPVDILVAQRYAALARRAAAEYNRAGNLPAAQQELLATAKRIRQYAGNEPELHTLAAQLQEEAKKHHERFSKHDLKEAVAMNYYAMEGKDVEGRKRRWNRDPV